MTDIDRSVPSGEQRVTQQCEVMSLTPLDHPLSTAYRRAPILGIVPADAKALDALGSGKRTRDRVAVSTAPEEHP